MKKIVLWSLCLLTVCAAFGAMASRAARAQRRLTEVYQAALDEALSALDSMDLALEKLLVSADSVQQAALLSQLSQAGASFTHSLATLPVDHHTLDGTMTFVGRVSGYADALLTTVAAQGHLPEEDRTQLAEELTACTRLCAEMLLARQAIAASASDFSLTDAEDAYPVLRYAGRYGTAVRETVLRDEPKITPDDAQALARQLFEHPVSTAYQRTSAGQLAAHEITVQTADLAIDLALTVQGGHLLWMTPRSAGFAQQLTASACAEAAAAYLEDRGLGPMVLVWQEQYSGLAVCTFAAEQEDVTLYADLVHVQVRMDTGVVVGFEASQYWLYHQVRQLPLPKLTADQAATLVSPDVTIDEHRLCLLPMYGEELLCYEFRVTRGDDRYLIYLDASTGREALIRKLVTTASGTRPV